MISYVAQIINLFAITIQGVLRIASLIGEVIVGVLAGITSGILNILFNISLFFQILYEDNTSVFTEEIPNIANDISQAFQKQWVYLQNGLAAVCFNIVSKISAIAQSIKWSTESLFVVIVEVLVLFKNTTILIGNTVWFMLTFIPVQLPQLLKAVTRNITDLIVSGIVDAYMGLLKITNFLTDVPLESFIGITSAIIIIRLFIHFRETIQSQTIVFYWIVIRKVWYCYYSLYSYIVDPEAREITRMSNGEDVGSRIGPSSTVDSGVVDDNSGADALCVICQERQKCVLTLPCRHVCLCTECCMRLYGYQRTCPICRTFIYHSVTVYL